MIEDFLAASDIKQRTKNMYRGTCPNHSSERNQNLCVFLNDNGGLAVYCHAGCLQDEIMDGIGLPVNTLYPPRGNFDNEEYKKRAVIKAIETDKNSKAVKIWNELSVLKQVFEARIFDADNHPGNKTECWNREKTALRMLPKLLDEYYRQIR